MPFYGGMSPYPERSGGGRPTVGRLLDSLIAQMGSAFSGAPGTIANAYAIADARVLAEAYGTAERLSYQWDPNRMTDMLPRWEKILRTNPLPTDSMRQRRQRIAIAFARLGLIPNYQATYDAIASALGPIPFTIVHATHANANVWTPVGWPMGTHFSGAIDSDMAPYYQAYPDWYSTISRIGIQVSQPATMGPGEFYQRLGAINSALDPILPSWVTWEWFRQDIHGSAGFFLDEPNLDQEAFRV